MLINNRCRRTVLRMLERKELDFSKFNLISVNTNCSGWTQELEEMKKAVGEENFKHVLFLVFDDVVYERDKEFARRYHEQHPERKPIKFFSKDEARQVIRFIIKTFEQEKDLIVHCSAGISRSTAISIFANTFANRFLSNPENMDDFNLNEVAMFEKMPMPNADVSAILNEVADKEFS